MEILNDEQLTAFARDGFLLVSGLIPGDISARAEATLWRKMGASPTDRSTWSSKPWASGHDDPEIVAVFTPEMAAVVDRLSEETVANWSPPGSGFALNVFPQDGEWSHHGPHIDHALEKDNFRVFPRPMRLASLIYLTDCVPHGGATVVWPGSHTKIAALAKSDPARFERMFTLNRALGELDLGDGVEVEGKRGDVLFYHYLCAHSGSKNVRDYPRFALAHKW